MTEYLILKDIGCLQRLSEFISILILEAAVVKMPLCIKAQCKVSGMRLQPLQDVLRFCPNPKENSLIVFGGGGGTQVSNSNGVFFLSVFMLMQGCLCMYT